MGIQDRDWYHEHRDKVAAADRAGDQQPLRQMSNILRRHQEESVPARPFSAWQQVGLFVLICLAVLGVLFLVAFGRAYWLR